MTNLVTEAYLRTVGHGCFMTVISSKSDAQVHESNRVIITQPHQYHLLGKAFKCSLLQTLPVSLLLLMYCLQFYREHMLYILLYLSSEKAEMMTRCHVD